MVNRKHKLCKSNGLLIQISHLSSFHKYDVAANILNHVTSRTRVIEREREEKSMRKHANHANQINLKRSKS